MSARQQAEQKELWNDSRDLASADFFTIGYTGRKLDVLLDRLEAAEVRSLVDIRCNPVSMYRPEVSKNNLKRAVEARGLEYVHLPNLGVPREIRARAAETGQREFIWEWYDQHVLEPYLGRNLHHFFNSVEHPAAFMCVELDPGECHRHRLFIALEDLGLRGFDL